MRMQTHTYDVNIGYDNGYVYLIVYVHGTQTEVQLSTDECAALIAALKDNLTCVRRRADAFGD